MDATSQILSHILEADEEDIVKAVGSPEGVGPAGKATVKGFKRGRMKIVDMPGYTFLISYLTPVAYYDKNLGTYFETSKQWSPTTNSHIHDWKHMIWKSAEHQADQRYWEKSDYKEGSHYVRYPEFHNKTQRQISTLFRDLITTMEMKPHMKRRLFRVDPRMRRGNEAGAGNWVSGHLKHHDTGEQGLPRPGEPGYGGFFTDFKPDQPEYWEWGSDLRNREPYDPDDPEDERNQKRRRR